jgi:hypothetical protein
MSRHPMRESHYDYGRYDRRSEAGCARVALAAAMLKA